MCPAQQEIPERRMPLALELCQHREYVFALEREGKRPHLIAPDDVSGANQPDHHRPEKQQTDACTQPCVAVLAPDQAAHVAPARMIASAWWHANRCPSSGRNSGRSAAQRASACGQRLAKA